MSLSLCSRERLPIAQIYVHILQQPNCCKHTSNTCCLEVLWNVGTAAGGQHQALDTWRDASLYHAQLQDGHSTICRFRGRSTSLQENFKPPFMAGRSVQVHPTLTLMGVTQGSEFSQDGGER